MTTASKKQSTFQKKEVGDALKIIRTFHKTIKKEWSENFQDEESGENIPLRRCRLEEINWNKDTQKEQIYLVRSLLSQRKKLGDNELFNIHTVFSKFNIDSYPFLKELDSRNDPRGSFALYEMYSGPFRFERHRNLTTAKKYLIKAAGLGFDKAKLELNKLASKKPQRLTRLDYWLQKGPAEDDIVESIRGLISQMTEPGKKISISDLLGKMVDEHVDYDGYIDSCEWEGDKLHLSIKGTKTTHMSLRSYFLVVEEFGGRLFEEI